MATLNGGGFGFPVTFQMTFSNIEDVVAGSELSSSTIPWNFQIPSGYDFYPVVAQMGGGGYATTGSITLRIANSDDDSVYQNMPAPAFVPSGSSFPTATVSAGACRVPAGTTIYATLQYSANWTTIAGDGSKIMTTIMGYLREAATE